MDKPLIPSNTNQTRPSIGSSISYQPAALCSALDVIAKQFPGFKIVGKPEQPTGGYINCVWRIRGRGPKFPKSITARRFPDFAAAESEKP